MSNLEINLKEKKETRQGLLLFLLENEDAVEKFIKKTNEDGIKDEWTKNVFSRFQKNFTEFKNINNFLNSILFDFSTKDFQLITDRATEIYSRIKHLHLDEKKLKDNTDFSSGSPLENLKFDIAYSIGLIQFININQTFINEGKTGQEKYFIDWLNDNEKDEELKRIAFFSYCSCVWKNLLKEKEIKKD